MRLSKLLETMLDLMYANCSLIKMGKSLRDWSFLATNTLVSILSKTGVLMHLSCWENACGFFAFFSRDESHQLWNPAFLGQGVAQLTGSTPCRQVNWASLDSPLLFFLAATWGWWCPITGHLTERILLLSHVADLPAHLWTIYNQKSTINERCSWLWAFLPSYWFLGLPFSALYYDRVFHVQWLVWQPDSYWIWPRHKVAGK